MSIEIHIFRAGAQYLNSTRNDHIWLGLLTQSILVMNARWKRLSLISIVYFWAKVNSLLLLVGLYFWDLVSDWLLLGLWHKVVFQNIARSRTRFCCLRIDVDPIHVIRELLTVKIDRLFGISVNDLFRRADPWREWPNLLFATQTAWSWFYCRLSTFGLLLSRSSVELSWTKAGGLYKALLICLSLGTCKRPLLSRVKLLRSARVLKVQNLGHSLF